MAVGRDAVIGRRRQMQRRFEFVIPAPVIEEGQAVQRQERHMDGQREFFQLPTGGCHILNPR